VINGLNFNTARYLTFITVVQMCVADVVNLQV